MAIITRKPRNASLRFQTFVDTSDLTKKRPEKNLVCGLRKKGGRNAYGRITMRHQGGGARRLYRLVDFKRIDRDIPGKVVAIEYDPNRNTRIALVVFPSGAKRYILQPDGIKVGSEVMAGTDVEARVGNFLPLAKIPVGFMIHNVELRPATGGKIARSAGTSIQIVGKDESYATLRMPSGEIRLVSLDCWATVGVLGNADYKNITWGKAGRKRHLGVRPTVRGMAMNPIDHPHGGGEGRSKSGSHPVSPWGKGSKGTRTRTRKNPLIVKRRK
ncbi:MAG: 50S ribosomal protein L2 [candidate division TM6 bacterium GW2011_GWE2_41_16]|nr:MAG: 50S ribosomal protein L2 [candidate division TM6 bacterium GW2011_GWE2_41_16]